MEKLAVTRARSKKTDPLLAGFKPRNTTAKNLFEGDIDLGNHTIEDYLEVKSDGNSTNGRHRNAIKSSNFKRWPANTIYFIFEHWFSEEDNATIAKAIKHIEDRTCIRIKPRSNNEPNFLAIIKDPDGCFTTAGMEGGKQNLSLPDGCVDVGTVVHELMHTIGFFHEQSRNDRDDYVEVKDYNIIQEDGLKEQFEKYSLAEINHLGFEYDYRSLMHYDPYAFSRIHGVLPTIIPKKKDVIIGQRKGLSAIDAHKVNKLYGCPKQPNVRSTPLYECKENANIPREQKEDCITRANKGECKDWKTYEYMDEYCGRACIPFDPMDMGK